MSSSNIAYILADMTSPDVLHALEYQINELLPRKPQAWFCDIVAEQRHWHAALGLKTRIQQQLEKYNPWETYGGDAIVIELNMVPVKGELRAKAILKSQIGLAQKQGNAENVNLVDQNGKKLPFEY